MASYHRQLRRAFTLVELTSVIIVITILIGILVPAIQKVRELASATSCKNNLHQLGLACLSHHDVVGGFPPAKTTEPTHSWVPFLLPYLGHDPLYRSYDFSVDWNAPPIAAAEPKLDPLPEPDAFAALPSPIPTAAVLPVLHCPSSRFGATDPTTDYSPTTTLLRPNPFVTFALPPLDPTYEGVLGLNVRRRKSDITDGCSYTFLLVEDAGRPDIAEFGDGTGLLGKGVTGQWADPANQIMVGGFDAATRTAPGRCAVNCTNQNGLFSFHPAHANALFADGTVRGMSSVLDIDMIVRLTTRNGKEVVSGEFN